LCTEYLVKCLKRQNKKQMENNEIKTKYLKKLISQVE
jgi:hypothetical protein